MILKQYPCLLGFCLPKPMNSTEDLNSGVMIEGSLKHHKPRAAGVQIETKSAAVESCEEDADRGAGVSEAVDDGRARLG